MDRQVSLLSPCEVLKHSTNPSSENEKSCAKKTDRKDADNRKLGDAETKERHLELRARASPHRWRLTQSGGSDKLAVASGAGGGRLTHRYGSCGGRSELKR